MLDILFLVSSLQHPMHRTFQHNYTIMCPLLPLPLDTLVVINLFTSLFIHLNISTHILSESFLFGTDFLIALILPQSSYLPVN